jgi:hypothetical protein
MNPEARSLMTIICREVLDIIASNSPANGKLLEIDQLIKSWVNANDLKIQAVERHDGFYRLKLKEAA